MNKVEAELEEAAAALRVPLFDVSERTAANIKTMKELADKRKHNKQAAADGEVLSMLENVLDAGYPLIVANMGSIDAGGLRNAWDIVRARMDAPGAVVLAGDNDGTPILLAAGTPEAVDAGFDAGAVIKAISPSIKGGGGGKAAMAQAGGKDASGLEAALEAARAMLVKA